jgi:hypothetical protein
LSLSRASISLHKTTGPTLFREVRQLTHALSDRQVMENIPDKSHITEAKVAAFHTCVLKHLATTGDGQWWAQVPTLQAGVAKLVDLALDGLDSAKTVYMLQVKTTTDAMATSLALPDFNGGGDVEEAMKEFIATHDMATIKNMMDEAVPLMEKVKEMAKNYGIDSDTFVPEIAQLKIARHRLMTHFCTGTLCKASGLSCANTVFCFMFACLIV